MFEVSTAVLILANIVLFGWAAVSSVGMCVLTDDAKINQASIAQLRKSNRRMSLFISRMNSAQKLYCDAIDRNQEY